MVFTGYEHNFTCIYSHFNKHNVLCNIVIWYLCYLLRLVQLSKKTVTVHILCMCFVLFCWLFGFYLMWTDLCVVLYINLTILLLNQIHIHYVHTPQTSVMTKRLCTQGETLHRTRLYTSVLPINIFKIEEQCSLLLINARFYFQQNPQPSNNLKAVKHWHSRA